MIPPIPDEQAALLRAIIADPDADAPRLVYADWLQEHGDDEQARFIRASVAASLLPTKAERQAAEEPLRAIDGEKRLGWMAALGVTHAGTSAAIRGFSDGALFWDTDSFFADGPMVFARLPVRELVIWQQEALLEEATLTALAAMPELARLHTLRLSSGGQTMPVEGFARLVASPHLSGLRTLTLAHAALTDAHARALTAPGLSALEELDLSENGLTAAGALAVLRAPRLAGLKVLELHSNAGIGSEADPGLYETLVSELTARFGSAAALEPRR